METSGDQTATIAHSVDILYSIAQRVASQQDTLTHVITERGRPPTSRISPPAIAMPEFNEIRSARTEGMDPGHGEAHCPLPRIERVFDQLLTGRVVSRLTSDPAIIR